MTFNSILFRNTEEHLKTSRFDPDVMLRDLNLDQIIDSIAAAKKEYNLKPFFLAPLDDVETIYYRHDVMRDMEDVSLMVYIKSFAEKMSIVRRYQGLVAKLEFNYHKKGWLLEAALVYCDTIATLENNLSRVDLKSSGFLDFRAYVSRYVQSTEFHALLEQARSVKNALKDVKYSILIQAGKFKVRKYENEADYSIQVEDTFQKFKQGAVKDYRSRLSETTGMNHIEAIILDYVARLHPEPFAALDRFSEQHSSFIDETISNFDREIQFYIAYLEFVAELKHKKLSFCYPEINSTSREISASETFDLALARILQHVGDPVVCNDFYLQKPERIIVVSGPNQGGKTTFARMFGQLHYLASLGCPVPGKAARLYLYDQLFTHFEREEDIRNLRGKLQDDLVRIQQILEQATSDSILILNEIFSSTSLKDAVFLSKEIMAKLIQLDLLCVWVTFIDELSSVSEKTTSMVSTVVPDNPAQRTFKIVRQPADGLAFALSIAKKHHLTYEQIKKRIAL
jgi:DNA mismatch repair protein MutS